MCWCRPEVRTPCCGRPECHPPGEAKKAPLFGVSPNAAMLIRDIAIGGNHLASSLIGVLGADFSERYPPNASTDAVREDIASRIGGEVGGSESWVVIYDMWVTWAAIMRARPLYQED